MLTRFRVQGFKNLRDVDIRFGPFTCIAGENGVGKSNVFDAIEFMSHLAGGTMVEAYQHLRGGQAVRSGDPRELFWDGYNNAASVMSFTADMLVPRWSVDDIGATSEATTTFLRYRLDLGYEPVSESGGAARLILRHEELTHITQGDANKELPFRPSPSFKKSVVHGRRTGGPFISTTCTDSHTMVNLHGDGGSRGRPRPQVVDQAGRTVLSTIITSEHPTVLAARREMQSWRRLALEPSSLRGPDEQNGPRELDVDGSYLAATLYRIAHEPSAPGATVDPERVYARVTQRVTDLEGLNIEQVRVELDPARQIFVLYVIERSGFRLPARALSEGTLRFLALCVLLEDPSFTGLICLEEPENGIFPSNLPAMINMLRDLAVDTAFVPGGDNPLRQVVINTHSPNVVQLCGFNDLLIAHATPSGTIGGLRLTASDGTWRSRADGGEHGTSRADLLPYLTPPVGGQFRLDLAV